MYWKTNEYINSEGKTFITFSFFSFENIEGFSSNVYWNATEQKMIFPQKKHLVIKTRICTSEEDFLSWFNQSKSN